MMAKSSDINLSLTESHRRDFSRRMTLFSDLKESFFYVDDVHGGWEWNRETSLKVIR